MNGSSFGVRGTWAATIAGLVLGAGAWTSACGGKAVVDGTSGGGGEAGAATTSTGTTSSSFTTPTTTTTVEPPPTTTSTTTPPPPSDCAQACSDLWDCTQQDDLCPGLEPSMGESFVDGCIPNCESTPAIIMLIDPTNCAGTIATLSGVSADFDALCHGTF